MNKALLTVFVTFVFVFTMNAATNDTNIQITENLASIPLSFTENLGQWDDKVSFRANAGGATMWFGSDGAYYQFTRTIESETRPVGQVSPRPDMKERHQQPETYETMMIKANFVGANLNPQMVGVDMVEYKCNYFIGNDHSKWATDVPNYTAVLYEGIYDGIDLKYYGNGRQMEYDFIVSPGADFSQIKIQYEGAESIAVNDNGELVVTTMWGEVVEQRPVIYQIENNSRIPIDGKYLLQSDNSFSFELSAYDKSLELVIDPVLSYSTYLGGYAEEICFDIDIDNEGNSYIVGYTSSSDFPTLDPYQASFDTTFGNTDIFVSKINPTGDALIFSTFLGGVSGDFGLCLDVGINNNIYISGRTASTDFPTQNAYQNTYGGGNNDIFVSKLGSSGNTLEYSTYLGGTSFEDAMGIKVDNNGYVYIAGRTQSTDFPTQNAFQATYGGGSYDGIVAKFDNTGSSLVYSTFLGGTDYDLPKDIAINDSGNAIIAGGTASTTGYPLKNAYQTTFGGGFFDNIITKLGADGDSLVFSTYFGGNDYDLCNAIDVDASGNIYIIGNTSSTNFPTQNPFQSTNRGGTYDVFVSKLNSSATTLEYSTYLGGSGSGSYDVGYGISINNDNKATVVGYTTSVTFPQSNSYQSFKMAGSDIFITTFNDLGNILEFSTYFGGSGSDIINAVAVNNAGGIYLAGYTNSSNFPALNPYQDSLQDTLNDPLAPYDIFITKFIPDPISYAELINPGIDIIAFGVDSQTITFDSVETTGVVTVEYGLSGPPVGSNLTVMPIAAPIFYNVSSTANFVGNVEVCFLYDPAGILSEDSVKLYHYDSTSNWVDVTTSIDTVANIVCGIVDHFSPFVILVPDIALSVEVINSPNLPDDFNMSQNYPNPFNPTTTIEFNLPTKSNVTINVYNLLGQQVQQLVNQELSAGSYSVKWDGKSSNGVQTSTGIYFYRIATNDFVETKKMLLLK